MRSFQGAVLFGGLLLASVAAQAQPALIASGKVTSGPAGADRDLSGLGGKLENGLPADMLGGIGSGLAYAGDGVMLALPDRGPNATPYNSRIDDTVTFIPRFDTISVELQPGAEGSALPFDLSTKLEKTTLLWSPTRLVYGSGVGLGVPNGAPAENTSDKYYFSGRSDDFDAAQSSCDPADARVDSESIRVSNDGKSVFVSDEYGPYLYEFDRATGKRLRSFALPANLCVAHVGARKKKEIADNDSGRTTNKGMEGLAITPDGKMLVGIMQAALQQDAKDPATKKLLRIVTIDIATGKVHEYGYMLTAGSGVSDIVAVNNHDFLVDERDGKGMGDGGVAKAKKIFRIDLTDAKDITDLSGKEAANAAIKKGLFADMVSLLESAGMPAATIPSKLEGLAFGPDVSLNGKTLHTLFVSNDNDFLPKQAGPNRLFVIGFDDGDLPGFTPQDFAAN